MPFNLLPRSVFWYFSFAVTLIWHTPGLFWARRKSKSMEPREFDKYIHKIASRWALGNAQRSGAKFHIEGFENIPKDQAVVFVANHQGDFDIAVFLAYFPIPHGYVAKIEMLKVPLLRDWMKNMRCIFIDRSSIRQTAGAMLEGIKVLQNGHSLVLFPEGTRSKSTTMGEFKSASFKLAAKAKVPIVPVTIDGTYKIMEENRRFIKPADVYVKIHPAIATDGNADIAGLSEKVRGIIEDGLNKV
ncbi:MAG: 1-acyl-sn-glycerol-3-phosphate acyltransferase [Defluviitaleaceae bacterium]|nr:1-acyl-sn-glycerol-3-phosphate acyltransferase [Defluviitaleaceae bacterium]